MEPVLWGTVMAIGGQSGHSDHFGLQPLGPCYFALTMPHCVRSAADGHPNPGPLAHGRRLSPPYSPWLAQKAPPVPLQPPPIHPIQKSPIEDRCVQAGVASKVESGLCHQCPHGERFVLLDWHHLGVQGDVGAGLDQDNQLPDHRQ